VRTDFSIQRALPMRQATELSVGVLFRILRIFLGDTWKPQFVSFSHSPPKNREGHNRILGSRVEFGQGSNAIVCRGRDLERSMPIYDPIMARYIQQYLGLIGGLTDATISGKVREFVWTLLPAGRCSIEHVADRMGVDRRTIHRRLRQEGTTFSSIVEGVRTEMVGRYLEEPNRQLYSVAQMLGFSALSAFSRWFRGHYACSASQWRGAAAPTDLSSLPDLETYPRRIASDVRKK
jgi:AraC-like DNA-binding protein